MSNINCKSVIENLSAFIDGEVDEKISYSIKKHLCECIVCRKKFSKLIKTQHLLKKYFEKSSYVPQSKIKYEEIFSDLKDKNINTIYIK